MNYNDEEVINELAKEYASIIRGVCRKFYLVGGSSDDLFQEGMIGLVEAAKTFDKSKSQDDGEEGFKRYAMVCIKRQIIDAIKHANTKKNMPLNTSISLIQSNDEDKEYEVLEAAKVKDPEEVYIEKEKQQERIESLLVGLSEFEKKVLNLYLQGMLAGEIARELGESPRSITNTIQRIKQKAKK